jgi:hypothetical protein
MEHIRNMVNATCARIATPADALSGNEKHAAVVGAGFAIVMMSLCR